MTKDSVRKQFGAEAASYAESKVHARGASLARMVELLEPQPGWKLLDIATGAGHTAFAFAPHVTQVTATDITPQMLELARRLAGERGLSNIIIETADAEALPYDHATFDLVTCRIAPHHFGDIAQFVRESARVLRPGGRLAIVDNIVPPGQPGAFINAFEKLRDPSHGRCLTIDEWLAAFQAAGLTMLHHELLGKSMDFNFWAKRHDKNMQAYLLSMLGEASGAVAEFLQPHIHAEKTTFKLTEGVFIVERPQRS